MIFKRAFIKVGHRWQRRSSRVISEKRETGSQAYHEAGQAILFHLLPDVGPVYTVSIHSDGCQAQGLSYKPLPEKDEMFRTKGQMLPREIIVDTTVGRVAEETDF